MFSGKLMAGSSSGLTVRAPIFVCAKDSERHTSLPAIGTDWEKTAITNCFPNCKKVGFEGD